MKSESSEQDDARRDAKYLRIFRKMAAEALEGNGVTPVPQQLAHLALPVLSAYLTTRAVERQEVILKKSSRAARLIGVFSLGLATVAITLSFGAYHSSSAWRQEQIPLLQKLTEQSERRASTTQRAKGHPGEGSVRVRSRSVE